MCSRWCLREAREIEGLPSQHQHGHGLHPGALGLGHPRFLLAEPERYTPGISTKVLTERLRKLTTFGRLCRTEHPGLPARVEYDLTPLDTGLAGILAQLRELNAVVEKETPPKKPE